MIPPLPPPMPPWPGGKPPWERIREGQQGSGSQQQAPPQNAQQQPLVQQPQSPQFAMRPQVIHGLVPPQLLHPTYPHWIAPQPYFSPGPPARPPQQQPAPQPQPQPRQQAQQAPTGPIRTEEKLQSHPLQPVQPVAAPGLPMGARHRHYWRHT